MLRCLSWLVPFGKLRCLAFHTSSWMTCIATDPTRRRFSKVYILHWKIFPLYDFPWSHTFDALGSLEVSHSFLQDAPIQAFVDVSSGMIRIISCAALLHDRMDLSWDALGNRGAMQVVTGASCFSLLSLPG